MPKKKTKKKSVKPTKISEEKSERGKKSRAKGQRFETKVRQDLENLGWVVVRWTNTVDYDGLGKIGKIVPAKRKYNPFLKALSVGTGFPDFICFKKINSGFDLSKTIKGAEVVILDADDVPNYEKIEEGFDVIGVEVKGSGYLDAVEKGMCIWLLENKIFSRILIARKAKKAGEIEYIDFKKKYNKGKKSQ